MLHKFEWSSNWIGQAPWHPVAAFCNTFLAYAFSFSYKIIEHFQCALNCVRFEVQTYFLLLIVAFVRRPTANNRTVLLQIAELQRKLRFNSNKKTQSSGANITFVIHNLLAVKQINLKLHSSSTRGDESQGVAFFIIFPPLERIFF